MTFDLADYLDLAEDILKLSKAGQGEDNAYIRCCISRAYYSVYCIARNVKGFKGYSVKDPHSALINAYKTSRSNHKKTDHRIGGHLANLKRLRISADYHEEHTLTKDDAKDGVEKAKICLKLLVDTYGSNYNIY